MLNEENYEILKDSFIESQRLFNKLGVVATNASNLDYDESGLYQEDEEMYKRHWLTLSSKIVDALATSLEGFSVELVKNELLETRELTFNLKKEEEFSKVRVNYDVDDTLNITQVS